MAGAVHHALQGQLLEDVLGVGLVLVAVLVDALPSETLAVEQSHPDQGQAEVIGSLQMVAGEDAKAARIDREGLREAEFE